MAQIVWTAEALGDRDAVFDWISANNVDAAIKQDLKFEKAVERLAQFPESGRPGRVAGTRELVVSETYVIPYAFVGDTVELLRVLHTSQMWPRVD